MPDGLLPNPAIMRMDLVDGAQPQHYPSDHEVVDLAHMCLQVYQQNPVAPEGWRIISSAELGLPDSFTDGMRFVNRNAAAFVKEAEIGGKKVISIVFRGTQRTSLSDWRSSVVDMHRHYRLMRPLCEALDHYIKENGIERVLVTGHSLGGSIAQMFLHERTGSPPEYVGVTFGSPPAPIPAKWFDRRITEFRHVEDFVARLTGRITLGRHHAAGRVISIDIPEKHSAPVIGAFEAHRISDYVESVERLRNTHQLAFMLTPVMQPYLIEPIECVVSGAREGDLARPKSALGDGDYLDAFEPDEAFSPAPSL